MNQWFCSLTQQIRSNRTKRYMIHLLLILSVAFSFTFHTNRIPQINRSIVPVQQSRIHELNAGNLIENQTVRAGMIRSQMNQSDIKTIEFKMEKFLCPHDVEYELLEYLIVLSYLLSNHNRAGRLIKSRIGCARRIFRMNMNQYIQDKDGKKRYKTSLNRLESR